MLPIKNISYLLPMCCSFWEKCNNSPKTDLGCSTPLIDDKYIEQWLESWSGAPGGTISTWEWNFWHSLNLYQNRKVEINVYTASSTFIWYIWVYSVFIIYLQSTSLVQCENGQFTE